LVAAEHHREFGAEAISSGNAALDALVGGGLHRGTSTLLIGGAGVGKTTIALTYAVAAADRGERASIFAFDEGLGTLLTRAKSLGIRLQQNVDAGMIELRQIDPAEVAPGQFASMVRVAVERDQAKTVVIDSLSGYFNAMPDERFLVLQMHELLSYLNQLGVITIVILAQHGLVGNTHAPVDISYLSDNVMQLRYFEADGLLRRAISVVKMRSGAHETKIREFQLSGKDGLVVGPPLKGFKGIFSGTPTYEGTNHHLMSGSEDEHATSSE
jgi:circadian clock protein KaiC